MLFVFLSDNNNLNLNIGFADTTNNLTLANSDSIELTIYGTTNCDSIFFGFVNNCPLDPYTYWFQGEYTELASVFVTGYNELKNVDLSFTADKDYEVLVIGGNCENNYISENIHQYIYLE